MQLFNHSVPSKVSYRWHWPTLALVRTELFEPSIFTGGVSYGATHTVIFSLKFW